MLTKLKSNKSKGLKIAVRVFWILFFAIFSLFIFTNKEGFAPESVQAFVQDGFNSFGSGNKFPYKLYETKVNNQNFKTIQKNLIFASNTDLVCLNSNAKEICKRNHTFSNPVLRTNLNRVLLYDAYNKGFEIGSLSNSFLKSNLKDDILTGNIAANGKYALVSKTNGFLGKLQVFESNEETPFFEYFFPDYYITDVVFSKNGKKCLCAGITANSGEILSSIFNFNYQTDEPTFKLDFNSSMILSIQFIDNKNLALIADNMISIVDTNSGTKTDYLFHGKNLTSFCVKNGKLLVSLSLSNDGDNCEILVFNKNGQLENTIKTNLKIKSLSYRLNKIAALSYGTTYIYNIKGNLIKSLDCFKNAKKIEFLSSKELYVLGLSDIKKLKI